jgi:hypothetical protein
MASLYTLYPNVTSKTAGTTAVALSSVSENVLSFTIQNVGSLSIYFGNSAVSSTNGLTLLAGEMLTCPQLANKVQHKSDYDLANYFVSAATSSVVIVWRDVTKTRPLGG